LQLEEVEGEIFGIFANWLYTQTIEDENAKVPSADQLIQLWILADRLLVPTLQNQALLVLDKQRQGGAPGSRPSSRNYNYAYEYTKDNSPLRLYIIEYCVLDKQNRIHNTASYPHQMLVDIINATRKRYPVRQCWKPTQAELESYMVDVPHIERDRKEQKA
jgi:ADP-dependent phosphofructokinase/glucokinase